MCIKLLLFIFFSIAALQKLQAQETPKTLLWRISGNSFTKPCYLYGTMHAADKRIYYLGDSVYSSISFCDGFAMEVDPGESVDTLINSLETKELNIAYKKAIENNLIKTDSGIYKRRQWEFDSAYNKLGQRYDDLSARDIARLRKAYRQRDRNDMNTTFDLYLFDLAKTQGKIMGGLEDISGRAAMLDELGNTFDPDLFLKNQRKKYVDVYEWMIVNYIAAELDKMHEFSKLGQTERDISIMLNNRNDIMARRIDSLGKIRSTFSAVGAAHLPGDSGVISLLQIRGFTVEPVFSSKKIVPGDYKITRRLNTLMSISDPDSNYIVQMPGKPTELVGITSNLVVKMYKELSNEIMLMCGVYEDGNMNKTLDKELEDIKYTFRWNDVKLNSTNKINRQGLDGYEINFKGQAGHVKLHLFYKNGKTYMFGAGAKDKDSLESVRCKNYMATYIMNLDKQKAETDMIFFESKEKAFSVSLPVQPQKETIAGSVTYTREDVTLFSSVDMKKKISYLVLLKEPFKGYYNDFDSTIFTQTTNEVLKGLIVLNMAEENVMLDNVAALKVKIRAMVDGKTQVIYSVQAMRHNRFYNLTARGLAIPGNELLFDAFFNSFKFLPYHETTFEKFTGGNNLFSVSAPSSINILHNRIAASAKRTDYYAYDNYVAMSYGITALGIDKYYWANERGMLLNDYARFHFNDSLAVNNIYGGDSLLYKKTVFNEGSEGRELLLKTLRNNTYSRIRIMHYADSVFILNIKGDKELITNNKADIFFNSFRFTNNNFTSTAFTSKTDLLIKDIQSADTVVSNAAFEALNKGFKFPSTDLQKILNAFVHDYGPANNKRSTIPELLSKIIPVHTGEALFSFIKTNYPLLSGKRENISMLMINILAACNNDEAYQLLKKFLLNDPPANADYEVALVDLMSQPVRASFLFPDIAIKIKDDQMGLVILELANSLIDSNKLQYNSIASYEDDVVRAGKKLLKKYQDNNNETFYPPHTTALVSMLARVNNKSSKSVLKEMLELQNYNLSAVIIVAMAKQNLPVAKNLLDWYCLNPNRRIGLYDDLVKSGRQSFFKGEYATQRSFADGFATIYTNNEIDEKTPKYYDLVAIKDAMVKNNLSRFYIYKVTCQFRRSIEIFTCIVGAFSADTGYYSIKEGNELYILHRKTFDAGNIDNLFNDFIKQVNQMK